MKRKDLSEEFIINGWLKKYHNITIEELVKTKPELCATIDWYKVYPCTQEQYEEWYKWAIDIISKTLRMSKKNVRRRFWINWLNCSPDVKK